MWSSPDPCRPVEQAAPTAYRRPVGDGAALASLGHVLAVYRVTGRGALKRLKRWPSGVVE